MSMFYNNFIQVWVISYTGYAKVLGFTSIAITQYSVGYIYIKRGFLENPPIQFDDLPLTRLMTPEGTPLDIPLTITNPLLTRYSAYPLV